MKTQFLLPLTLTAWLMSSVTQAAPTPSAPSTSNVTGSGGSLPPLIPERTQPVSSLPQFNLTMEDAISDRNGPLPKGTEKKGPWAMQLPKNFSPPTAATTFSEGDDGVTQASAEQIDTSVLRAQLAADSYCRKVVPGGKWDCPHCSSAVEDANIELTFTTAKDDTNGFIITSKSQETIFLVFRGTNSIRSAVVDMKFIKSKYPPVGSGAEVHTGFYDSYVAVQEKVLTAMDQLFTKYPNYKIDITGHSLGAAQAVLGAMDLYQRNSHVTPSNTKLYTYGEPRVGNQAFAAYVKSTKIPKIRTVHAADMVPHLPPMSLGFVHSGDEYWIKDDKSKATEICSAEYESDVCANSAVPFLSFLDHLTYYGINEGLCLK